MELRKILLRIMLWSLGLAAAAGVLAMLFFRGEIIARVVGTALMTAVAAGLMMALSLLAGREKSRSAGVLGMAGVVAEYLPGLVVIWGIDNYWSERWFEAVGVLMLTIACVVPPAMFFLRILSVAKARLAGRVGLGLSAAVFLLFIIPPWFSVSWANYGDWCGTALVVAIFGIVGVASLAGAGSDRRYWRYAGVLAAIAAASMGIVAIWHPMNRGDTIFAIIASLAAVVAHANLVLLCPLKPGQRWLAYGTIAAALLAAAFIDLIVFLGTDGTGGKEMLSRIAGSAGILAACGSLTLLVLAALNRKLTQKPVLAEIHQYTLICPGCNKKQTFPVGDTQCPTCRLGIHVHFNEPHCPQCNYLLYMLASDRCPECGALVRGTKPVGETAAVISSD